MKSRMTRSGLYFAFLLMSPFVVQMGVAGAFVINSDANEPLASSSIDDCEARPDFVGASTARTLSTSSQQRAQRKACIAAQLRLALYLQETFSCGSPVHPAGSPASLGNSLNFVMTNIPKSNLSVVASKTEEVTCRVLLSDVEFTALHHLYLDQVSGVNHDPKQQ
jgi:hypothetical protein